MFAIDGVKLPGNASKARSGTHEELAHRARAIEQRVKTLLKAHREQDAKERGKAAAMPLDTQAQQINALKAQAKTIRRFLRTQPKRQSAGGTERKSNLTDNDSAKMATAKGVIQGCHGGGRRG